MGDFVRGGGRRGWLIRLRKGFLKKYSLVSQGGASSFLFIFLGTVGGFTAVPEIDASVLIDTSPPVREESVSQALSNEERCRWQRDFSFFSNLGEGKDGQAPAPCVVIQGVLADSEGEIPKNSEDPDLDRIIRGLTAGYPLEIMVPAIVKYDRSVAALIVGIAKKESNWGKRVPRTSDGADCFNYWGWKGAGSRGVAMGHGCFGTPEEAVQAIGNRLTELVAKRQGSEPKNMIVWKCGSSCATHSPESVSKWIADVDLYYRQIVKN